MDIVARPVQPFDVEIVAAAARQQDVAEMWASSRSTVHESLTFGAAHSRDCWTLTADGHPVLMFGVVPSDDGSGVIWAVLTHWVEQHPIPFLRVSRDLLDDLMGRYGRLHNVADARNDAVIRWLLWLGFWVSAPEPFGPDGLDFCHFEMSTTCATQPH